jgi:hypothetical protein
MDSFTAAINGPMNWHDPLSEKPVSHKLCLICKQNGSKIATGEGKPLGKPGNTRKQGKSN